LETDSSLLASKSHQSLTRYGHQLVIGNLLQNHKNKVIIYTQDLKTSVAIERSKEEIEHDIDIEKALIEEVVKQHKLYIQKYHTSEV
jgi:phosphopantothenate-cysteine ligase